MKEVLKKKRNEVDFQTLKLVSSCENLKLKYIKNNKKQDSKNDKLLLEYLPKTIQGYQKQKRSLNNYLNPKTPKNQIIKINNKSNKNKSNKKIRKYDYFFLKEKYIRYISKLKEKEKSDLIPKTISNCNSKKRFIYNNINNNCKDNYINKNNR